MKYLSIFLVCGIVSQASANSIQTCSNSDSDRNVSRGGWVLSKAEFWKGIEGGELIDDLTDDNFDQWVADNPYGFTMFYWEHCRYCVESREGFGGAAKEMDGRVKFAGVDCENAGKACKSGGKAKTGYPKLKGVPSFFLFKDGKYSDKFEYQRTKDRFVYWLNKRVPDESL